MTFKPTALAVFCAALATAAHANDFADDLQRIAEGTVRVWVEDPAIIDAVRAQNLRTTRLSQEDILALDTTWRDQTVTGGALIDGVLGNALSHHLTTLMNSGPFTEIFISDVRGLNVGQSAVTSDYWQGDEAKWQVPHATGDIHIGDVEFDESAQSYQSQVSVPILDAGVFIGVITVGIDLQRFAALN